jgi:HEPN domain-containing protein
MRPPEEVRRELVRQWVQKAEQDFALAEHLLSESAGFLPAAGFHWQQACEKFLKALLVSRQVEFPKTHDLDELLDLVASVEAGPAEDLREASGLTPYGVEIRYPGDSPEMGLDEAREASRLAGRVRDTVLSLLASALDR